MRWIRGDLLPPVQFVHREGQDFVSAYTLSVATAPLVGAAPAGEAVIATFPITAGVDDQYVYKTGIYPPASSVFRDTSYTQVSAQRNSDSVVNGLLNFHTASLPDAAVVSEALLIGKITNLANTNSLGLQAGWYAWDGTSASDYSANPETNAISDVPLSSLTLLSENTFSLANLTNVSTTADTRLRLHISQRPADAAPTGQNYVVFSTFEAGEPMRLQVTYTV